MTLLNKEIRLALTAILAVGVIYLGIIFLKGLKIFSNDTAYYVEMSDISGLNEGDQVLANGMSIGYIKHITYNEQVQTLNLELCIDKDFHITKGTTVFTSKEMLGSCKINLKLAPYSSGFLSPGDTLYGSNEPDIMSSVASLVPRIEGMIPKLDSILSNVNTLCADPALAASIHNIEGITSKLHSTTRQLNTIMHSSVPTLLNRANNVCTNIETLTTTLNSTDIQGIAAKANGVLSDAGVAVNHLNHSLTSRDNTLGILLNDNSVALHLDTTILNASALLRDLRENPKRYVHFSVFGKK